MKIYKAKQKKSCKPYNPIKTKTIRSVYIYL